MILFCDLFLFQVHVVYNVVWMDDGSNGYSDVLLYILTRYALTLSLAATGHESTKLAAFAPHEKKS